MTQGYEDCSCDCKGGVHSFRSTGEKKNFQALFTTLPYKVIDKLSFTNELRAARSFLISMARQSKDSGLNWDSLHNGEQGNLKL